MPIVFSRSGTVTADTQWDFDKIDLSPFRRLTVEVKLTANAAAAAGDTLNVYLQERKQGNAWSDRAALVQLIGTMLSGEVRQLNLSAEGPLSDTEESYEPSGSTGGSRLTAGLVINGPFAPNYRDFGVGMATAWRFDLDITNVTGPSFPLKITVYGDE